MFRYLLILALCFTSSIAMAGPFFNKQRVSDDLQWRFNQDERRELATEAFTNMFMVAARNFREADKPELADRLMSEWNGRYRAEVLGRGFVGPLPEDVGDHQPYSEWIRDWYQVMEDQFGVEFMNFSRLRDIWILNFTLPVVFNPEASNQWCVTHSVQYPADTCEKEYARHFVGTWWAGSTDPYNTAFKHHGFAGVISYWVVWTACEIATYGTGWFIICMPAAQFVETTIELFVAPDVSDKIYAKYNP